MNLTAELKNEAKRLGFCALGITSAEPPVRSQLKAVIAAKRRGVPHPVWMGCETKSCARRGIAK